MNKCYVINRNEKDFWQIEELDSIITLEKYKEVTFYDDIDSYDNISITCNEKEKDRLINYAMEHDISIMIRRYL